MNNNMLLDKYVTRILELQKESRNKIRDLDGIASELGFSADEIVQIRTQVEDSVTRSRQYLKSGMHVDAVAEATRAHELSPWDANIASLLGSIYETWSKGKLFPAKLQKQAEYWYKEAVRLEPKHPTAFIGLQNLAKMRQARLRKRLAVAIVLIAGFYLIGILYTENGPRRTFPPTRETPPASGQNKGVGIGQTQLGTEGLPGREVIPVITEFNLPSDGVGFESQSSLLNRYSSEKNSFSCDIRGLFRIAGREVYKLSVKAVWYDKDGNAFREKTVDLVNAYSAPLKSGEVLPVRILEYSEGDAPSLSRVVLSVSELDADASAAVSGGRQLAIVWKTAQTEGMSIEAYLRSQSTASGSKDYVVKSVLVIKNSGQSRIQFVRVRPVFKKNGAVVKTGTERIVLMHDDGFLPPGEKFPFLVLDSFSKTEFPDSAALFDTMELEVVSLE